MVKRKFDGPETQSRRKRRNSSSPESGTALSPTTPRMSVKPTLATQTHATQPPPSSRTHKTHPQAKPTNPRPNASTTTPINTVITKGQHISTVRSADVTRAQPRSDPVYGQREAFPGLEAEEAGRDGGGEDEGEEEEEEDGPPMDGTGYLRMVRREARGLPGVFVAGKGKGGKRVEGEEEEVSAEEGESDGGEDTRGFYIEDGYVAAPTCGPFAPPAKETWKDGERRIREPQDVYHDMLNTRFAQHRARLQQPPPDPVISQLDADHPISVPHDARARKVWRKLLLETEPGRAQIGSMDNLAVLDLLRLAENYLVRGRNVDGRLSVWLWALLGKLSEVGTLGSEEVGVVRGLGKKAGWVLEGYQRGGGGRTSRVFRGGYADEDGDEEEGLRAGVLGVGAVSGRPGDDGLVETGVQTAQDGSDANEGRAFDKQAPADTTPEAADPSLINAHKGADTRHAVSNPSTANQALSTAKSALPARLTPEPEDADAMAPDVNTLATLDMLITVAADFYGQKDLLPLRMKWEVLGGLWTGSVR
ncbi:hypothetical protein LTR66_004245 [Elasticomyces elasticus]|nr:hypothetical protein LTR66_004245 [Elasticomyces elasticus]